MTIFPQSVSYLYSLDTANWLVRSSCINEMGPDSFPPTLGLVAGYLEKQKPQVKSKVSPIRFYPNKCFCKKISYCMGSYLLYIQKLISNRA